MDTPDEMAIELSKKKWLLVIAGSTLFVILGFWLLTLDLEAVKPLGPLWNPISVRGAGWVSVIFFGLCGIVGLIKLLDRKPGLQFTKMGIIDNASGVSAGLIPWSDILGTEIYEFLGQRSLVVKVINPDGYIETGNPLKRWTKKGNYNLCGSPITISSKGLKIDFNELVNVFNAYISKYGVNVKPLAQPDNGTKGE
ncbi:MAG: STM3941 family protein [Desulfomonilaceae bacterium]